MNNRPVSISRSSVGGFVEPAAAGEAFRIRRGIRTGGRHGEAASLALDEGRNVAAVPIRELQRRLEEDKVMVHFPDAYIPEGRPFSFRGFTHGSAPGHF